MSPGALLAYLGSAAGYSLVATALLGAVLWALGRKPGVAGTVTVWLVVFFVLLTLLPLPDPARLSCPVPYTEPQLQPLYFLSAFRAAFADGFGLRALLGNITVASTLMNIAICAVIGMALAAGGLPLWKVGLAVAVLSLTVELTQLTGIWGLYPCPYRQFDIDDLITNTGGGLAGVLLWRLFGTLRRR